MDAGNVRSSCSAPSVRTRTRTESLLRLDVHVGGAVADGLLEDQVDDLDDRRVLVDLDRRRRRSCRRSCLRRTSARCSKSRSASSISTFDWIAVVERPLDSSGAATTSAHRRLERFDQPLLEVLDERVRARDDARARPARRPGARRSSRAIVCRKARPRSRRRARGARDRWCAVRVAPRAPSRCRAA